MTNNALITALALAGSLAAQAMPIDIHPSSNSNPRYVVSGSDLFIAASAGSVRELHRYDTLTDSLTTYSGFGEVTELVVLGDRIIFTANNGPGTQVRLRALDPSTGTIVELTSALTGNVRLPKHLVAGETLAFCNARQTSNGEELCVTDGTIAGTRIVTVRPGNTGSLPEYLGVCGDLVFFSANGGTGNGMEAWVCDGVNVAPLSQTNNPQAPAFFTESGSRCYFAATQNGDRELWWAEGTVVGNLTIGSFDIWSGSSSTPNALVDVDGSLYFSANGGANIGREVYRVDPQSSPFVVNNYAGSSDPTQLTESGGKLFFSANIGGGNGRELFVYDPQQPVGANNPSAVTLPGGAVINLGAESEIASIGSGSSVAFDGDNGTGFEPWATSGTIAKPIDNIAITNAAPEQFQVVGEELFFVATDQSSIGNELWKIPLGQLATASWQALGEGCALANGVVPGCGLTDDLVLNTTSGVVVDGAPSNGIILIAGSLSQLTLPFGSCTLYLGADAQLLTAIIANGVGVGTANFPVPASASFIGQQIIYQAMVLENGGPALGFGALTNAVRAFVGC